MTAHGDLFRRAADRAAGVATAVTAAPDRPPMFVGRPIAPGAGKRPPNSVRPSEGTDDPDDGAGTAPPQVSDVRHLPVGTAPAAATRRGLARLDGEGAAVTGRRQRQAATEPVGDATPASEASAHPIPEQPRSTTAGDASSAAIVVARRAAAAPAAPPPRPLARPAVVPTPSPPPPRRGAASTPSSPVHLHIGRVEIRAAVEAPATAPPPTPRSRPDHTLADYLRDQRPRR